MYTMHRIVLVIAVVAFSIASATISKCQESKNGGDKGTIPLFIGYFSNNDRDGFAIKILNADGTVAQQGWTYKGRKFGGFSVVDYDSKTETLVVETEKGELLKLRLAEAKVKSAELPALSKEQAKEWLEAFVARITKNATGSKDQPALNFDIEKGATAAEKRDIMAMKNDAKLKGQTFIAARLEDGHIDVAISYPMKRSNLPEPVLRNISDAEFDEFNLYLATASFVAQAASKVHAGKK